MNYKNKVIVIIATVLILGFFYWYFLLKSGTENKIPMQVDQLTADQKLDLVSNTSFAPTLGISDSEKESLLNMTDTGTYSVSSDLSEEEKLEILKNTN